MTPFFQNSSLWFTVGRGFLKLPMLWRPSSIAYPTFLKFCPTPLPCWLQPSLQFYFWCLLFWLNVRSCHIWCVILLNDIMDLYMSRRGTLVPEWPCYVFYATRCQVYSGLTNVFFCWYSNLIKQAHIQTKTHSILRGQ